MKQVGWQKTLSFLFVAIALYGVASCATHGNKDNAQSAATLIYAFATEQFSRCPSGGVVLVAKESERIFEKAFGIADLELNVPMRTDHVLATGSITKSFTAAAILTLIRDSKLSLKDDVRKYVPDFQTHGQAITIEQVLTHTSGLPNFVDLDNFAAISKTDLSPADILQLTSNKPLHFSPGTGYYYSDTGYILLGLIIEKITGMSYADYVENKLFRPLGMSDTWSVDNTRIIPNHAKGYSVVDGRTVHASYLSMTIPYAAGAIFSTAEDLLIWLNALKNGAVIPDELLENAWSPATLKDETKIGYGFGWQICDLDGHKTIEHSGFINGFGANLLHLPDENISIIVMVNNDADLPEPGFVARAIARILLKEDPHPTTLSLDKKHYESILGRYVIANGNEVLVYAKNDTLYMKRNDRKAKAIVALSSTDFIYYQSDESLVFSFGSYKNNRFNKLTAKLRCEPLYTAIRTAVLEN